MNVISDDLFEIAQRLHSISVKGNLPEVKTPLTKLIEIADKVGKSWSGSWLGYHSRVYYRNLEPPPPGARFSQEWGFMDLAFIRTTVGDWVEFDYGDVRRAIYKIAGNPDLKLA